MKKLSEQYNAFRPFSAAKVFDGPVLQKCKTLQYAEICATSINSQQPHFQINLRVGAHKHFKLTQNALNQEYAALLDEFGDELLDDDQYDEFEDDDDEEYDEYEEFDEYDDDEVEHDEDTMDKFFDEGNESEWIVTSQVTNEYDADWEDDSKWDDIDQVITYSARKLKKKCMKVFGRKLCLCEFLEFVAHKNMFVILEKQRKTNKN
eukprot:TRINITY_DN30559_c0_g1_i1.p1 TRINITY_DN30559_c0_g1~~TRINITY_DN30559_c0_g1_i1.p1  ORF type:complete len:231 (-),score=55.82 TRINITY_DN30559_c0_g1_i1:197-814(-)